MKKAVQVGIGIAVAWMLLQYLSKKVAAAPVADTSGMVWENGRLVPVDHIFKVWDGVGSGEATYFDP